MDASAAMFGFEPLHEPPDRAVGEHRVVLVHEGRILLDASAGALPLLADVEHLVAPTHPLTPIGRLGERHWWTASHVVDVDPAHEFADLRSLHALVDATEWNAAGRGTQLLDWLRDHAFCGRCGTPTELAPGERALRCPVDGHTAYPRLSPAVIVLVEREDGRALLARSGRWNVPMYSTLAGFVEPGESLEDTVHREIREEVGVEVTDIRYVSSQPWPFPNSLMLGFTAAWAGGEIVVDGDEIAEANWYTPDDLPMLPPPMSIARSLIDGWLARQG